MANKFEYKINGLDDFLKAIKRNPELVIKETRKFLQRAIAKYKAGIIRNPWRVGMSGGGSPVLTGNMRDTHLTDFKDWEARIYPTTNYAEAVHKNRPWLDHVFKDKEPDIRQLEDKFLETIVKDLAD